MKINFTQHEFDQSKSEDKLSLICQYCDNIFYLRKASIKQAIEIPRYFNKCKYCSAVCLHKARTKQQQVNCKQCNKQFMKRSDQIKKSKNNFCSQSCAATYNNTHKTTGYRRSKLEVWLESKLPTYYPNLQFEFNKKDTINSELDIFIPSLKLAFELNGIFHYEPIYGPEKLNQIQNNDTRKFQACLEHNIELCIIDTSKINHFKEQKAQEILDIISNVINIKLSNN